MPNPIPPFRPLSAISDRNGRPTAEFTRWLETLMDAVDSAGDVGAETAAELTPVSASVARTVDLSPVTASHTASEGLAPV